MMRATRAMYSSAQRARAFMARTTVWARACGTESTAKATGAKEEGRKEILQARQGFFSVHDEWHRFEIREGRFVTTREDGAEQPLRTNAHGLAMLFPGASRALKVALPKSLYRNIDGAISVLLPQNFSVSVPPSYFKYTKWYALGAVASSACMVLSTQSMLYAIGLGAGAIPVAAALNWVLKDGLGQLGGVLFASMVNRRFDADPKRWRVVAAAALDISSLLEAATPLFPTLFLPVAAIANAGKNISWLAASATRAGIHLSFALQSNLADLTAKAGSQGVVASTIGTAIGIGISPLLGSSPSHILPVLLMGSAIHLGSMLKALTFVSLASLNAQRGEIVALDFIASGGARVPSPDDVALRESFIGPGARYVLRGHASTSILSLRVDPSVEAMVTSTMKEGRGVDAGTAMGEIVKTLSEKKYAVSSLHGQGEWGVGLLVLEDASSKDLLRGHLEACHLCKNGSSDDARAFVDAHFDAYLEAMRAAGWNTEDLFLEDRRARAVLPN
eukprot:g331.t1